MSKILGIFLNFIEEYQSRVTFFVFWVFLIISILNHIITKMVPDFGQLTTTPIPKINNFPWVCWFLGRNLSNFVSPDLKLHDRIAVIGKTGKTAVLPRFYGKELGCGRRGDLVCLSRIYGCDPGNYLDIASLASNKAKTIKSTLLSHYFYMNASLKKQKSCQPKVSREQSNERQDRFVSHK